jgi:DNA-binding LacI/PurR family transcriptional regulator
VAPDFFGGTRLVWQEAVARGYRRIGAALSRHTPLAVEDDARLAASQLAQYRLVAPADRIPFLLSDPMDRDAFHWWFEEHKPDMVIGFVHDTYDWLRESGLRVPEDVAFACLLRRPHHPFSGIDPQTSEVGRQAVDLLVAQVEANRFGLPEVQQMVLLEPKWEEGSTLPPRPGSSGKRLVSFGAT